MKRRELLILRHAKSAWDTDSPADFDRPLGLRGLRASKRMGRYLVETGLLPDAIVCSSATRAVQTIHGVARAARLTLETVRFDGAIYEADLSTLLDVLGECDPDAHRTMIVGHNPGLEYLLDHLAGGVPVPGDGKLLPTATLARLTLPGDWRRLERGRGRACSALSECAISTTDRSPRICGIRRVVRRFHRNGSGARQARHRRTRQRLLRLVHCARLARAGVSGWME